jgi:hypothetical protein
MLGGPGVAAALADNTLFFIDFSPGPEEVVIPHR